jgi:hypothetical protein
MNSHRKRNAKNEGEDRARNGYGKRDPFIVYLKKAIGPMIGERSTVHKIHDIDSVTRSPIPPPPAPRYFTSFISVCADEGMPLSMQAWSPYSPSAIFISTRAHVSPADGSTSIAS